MSVSILPIGGRIKAASLSPSDLNPGLHPEFQKNIKDIINGKKAEVNECFFPFAGPDLRTRLRMGFLRPYIKTDQGMPGNFYPFIVNNDPLLESPFQYRSDHFEAILEPRYSSLVSKDTISQIQELYKEKNLKKVYSILQTIDPIERASIKGRSPFFVCRPSYSDNPITVPVSLLPEIESKVQDLLEQGSEKALQLIQTINPGAQVTVEDLLSSVLYFQPDVHIGIDGKVTIEKINLPDVGFFLESFSDHGALKDIKDINRQLRSKVIDKILSLDTRSIYLLTNAHTIQGQEDLLEINEIDILKGDLLVKGVTLQGIDISGIDDAISSGVPILLGNIDYKVLTDEEKRKLFNSCIKYPYLFKPNPFMQIAMQKVTGLQQSTSIGVREKVRKKFLDGLLTLSNTNPTDDKGFGKLENTIQEFYSKIGFDPRISIINIFNAQGDFYPIHMQSIASMGKISQFIKDNNGDVTLSQVPYMPGNERLQKGGGDILHFYRFMGISGD